MLIYKFCTGSSYLEFSKGLSFLSEISTTPVPCKLTLCACLHFNIMVKMLSFYKYIYANDFIRSLPFRA